MRRNVGENFRSDFLAVNTQYGTFKRGISRAKPVVRSIFLGDETGESGADFDKLSELPDELNRIKQALVSFDPNDGVFYISGDKPAGFEDFSEMWLAVKNYDSKGADFPAKKHGEFGYAQKVYKLRNIYFDGKIRTFETEIIEGVSFSFNGKFAKPKLDSHGANADDNVLQGHLIKFVVGRKTAKADSVFSFSLQGE